MRRREARRQRERELLPETLIALVKLIPAGADARRYLEETYGIIPATSATTAADESAAGEHDSVIAGAGLKRLVAALGEACPEGAMDLVRVARRVPRSQSTCEAVQVPELCFAISNATGPVGVHERRRNAAGQPATPVDETSPLLQFYHGRRFAAIVTDEDTSSPAGRARQREEREAGGAKDTTEEEGEDQEGNGEDPVVAKEWHAFTECISTTLPMTLRVHNSGRALERVARAMLATANDGSVVRSTEAMPPAAQLYSCSDADYHSHPREEFMCRTLHSSSAVSFQEVVSAIPVLALGLEPHHTVLDMCAAPGSKTLQALDAMLRKGWDCAEVKRGVLIANEKDRVKATQTLPARLKRYHAPNVMSTRCDAVQWPRLYVAGRHWGAPGHVDGGGGGEEDGGGPAPTEQLFDRVICDVPCSGDGTIRKEPSVAGTWSAAYVKSLVPTQTALLRRGLDMLADGGVLVYSTCSMNPREDEEVVCAGLELFAGCVELLDVNAILEEQGARLASRGGLASPNVEGLFTRALPAAYDGAKVLRVLPHRNNTGGFFIAAFRKIKQLELTAPTAVRLKLNQWTKGKLWAPVRMADPVWASISSFYGFDPADASSFSYYLDSCTESGGRGLVPLYHLNPHGDSARRIVLATPALASMILGVRPFKGPGVEVVCVGARAFEAYDKGRFMAAAECRWRAVVESAAYLAPRFTRRMLALCAARHRSLLEELFRTGSVALREHWPTILCDAAGNGVTATAAATVADAVPLVKDGPVKDRILAALAAGDGPDLTCPALAAEVAELLPLAVRIGGVLVGVTRGDGKFDQEEGDGAAGPETPWFLSATLTGHRLELSVDASQRTYGLMAYLDIFENCNRPTQPDTHTTNTNSAAAAVAEVEEEEVA